ncbi:isocitrate lyase/PEP mutase family protein [Methylobacterium nonmethylotrophicum]|uniref:Isocitrate lyase/phosphoenolpyruvate mutase family protein n=1 Tax=Methylobacterium nonmethylotrophicum TaxID=1141884 RepID=A0A4Z0ND90_9HYPH|nr:isocitrate lyase/phosphoenolpyruvate mutase family protein [Methylobacterium nonmethylotrophicum]TGD93313.1 isocitrate lyase/phosphoenolpyruvate mutase family protein [Methylobacterium nonmethylotrophicum]
MPATIGQLTRFASRHAEPGILVLPNAWNAGSAILMAEAGFEFIATTSAGIAHALGVPEGVLRRDEMVAQVAHIVRAVDVPVTADLEDGYGPRPEDVATTLAAVIEVGVAGANIEDSGVGGDPCLIEAERMCDRIRAARDVIARTDRPFVLNVRTDPYLVRRNSAFAEANFAEAVRRAGAYAAAGADCVFIPGAMDAATVERLAASIDAPLNVLGARGGSESTLTIADFARLGVRRVSIGGSLALAAMGLVRDALASMREGDFIFSQGAPTNAEMDIVMSEFASRSILNGTTLA